MRSRHFTSLRLEQLERRHVLAAEVCGVGATQVLVGDIDLDGTVAFADFLILADHFGLVDNATQANGDINCDAAVDFADFLLLADNFGKSVQDRDPPTVVLFNLDDADVDLLDAWAIDAYFPNIKRVFQDGGTRFSNFHSIAPLCGPSRGALFRGQYPHNTGIVQNELGWQIFYDNGYTDQEIGMWMRDAGYTTALIGKYCHEEYPLASKDNAFVPPGWDDFRASLGAAYLATPRSVNGTRVANQPDEYRTDVESREAVEIIQAHDFSDPLFLYVAPFAPHSGPDRVPLDFENAFPEAIVPRTPDYNELDVSDKTPQFAALPLASQAEIDRWDQDYRERIRAMLAVDRMVGEIFEAIEQSDARDNTYFFLTSDNGFQLLQHRDLFKQDPFDRVSRVQLLVRGPGVAAGQVQSHLMGHVDLVPTILELAEAPVPHFVDGKSFVPLLEDPGAFAPDAWRSAILIENSGAKLVRGLELDIEYQALRRYSDVYVEWANGDREYYDLATDPYQLENLWSNITNEFKTQLAAELETLHDCQGSACFGGLSIDAIDTALDLQDETIFESGDVSLSGMAFDDESVARVEVVIRRVSSRQYLQDDGFGSDYQTLRAVLTNPDSATTQWHLDVSLPGGEYWVSARGVDVNGNEDSVVPTAFFTIAAPPDIEPPTTKIVTPAPGVVPSTFVASGVASDDRFVERVAIVLRTRGIASYWNGESFQDGFVAMPATVVSSGRNATWELELKDIPPGDYALSARAFDDSGNQQDPDIIRVVVEEGLVGALVT